MQNLYQIYCKANHKLKRLHGNELFRKGIRIGFVNYVMVSETAHRFESISPHRRCHHDNTHTTCQQGRFQKGTQQAYVNITEHNHNQ